MYKFNNTILRHKDFQDEGQMRMETIPASELSSELMAFQTKIVQELLRAIINHGAYIQTLGEMEK